MHRVFLVLGFLWAGQLLAQDPLERRYTFEVDEEVFPQKKPDDALKSVVRAITSQKFDYMIAQLVDPFFVDRKVADYKKSFTTGKEENKALRAFARLVKETQTHLLEDPALVQDLKQFVKEAEWKLEEDRAIGTAKKLAGRQVFMRKVGERWFLEDKQKEKQPNKGKK